MNRSRILVINLPTLRLDWVASEMPGLDRISRSWHRAKIEPVFPALTCPTQATLTTGAAPREHGIIANGLFDRQTRRPEFWVFTDEAIRSRRIWEDFGKAGRKTGVFFFLNIRETQADVAILPKPIHRDDGSMEMWCWHRPEGLYPRLVERMGHFNLLKFWGPMAGIESSAWIADCARATILEENLDLSFIYLPHTDYAPQKFGPDSGEARAAHRELDLVITGLIEGVGEGSDELQVVVCSEYAITEVSRCLFPNRILRETGLLAIETKDGREYVDYARSPAFAMADHQIAHVYCQPGDKARIAALFEAEEALAEVIADPAAHGLDCDRCGDVILVARRDAWLAYPWWEGLDLAPFWAKTIDIHNKPGYDPLEMFWDPEINGTSQDPARIKGSHGAFAVDPDQKASLISNLPGAESIRSTAGIYSAIMERLR